MQNSFSGEGGGTDAGFVGSIVEVENLKVQVIYLPGLL